MSEEQNHNPEITTESAPTTGGSFSTMPVFRQLAIIGALLFGVFGLGATAVWLGGEDKPSQDNSSLAGVGAFELPDQDGRITFEDVDLEAQAAIVVDLQSGSVLYEKSADEEWPLASITKLMTALVASELVEEGSVIPVTAAAVDQAGEGGVLTGERFSYRSLSDLVLLTSSNDGAYALAAYAGGALDSDAPDAAFVKAMNVRAKELGLEHTYFRNPTGLDLTETEAGAYGTAREVAKLLEYILENKPEILEATAGSGLVIRDGNGSGRQADNTNYVVDAIPTAIASKTGYTTLAGGNLAIAFDAGFNRPVIAVVLGSSHQGRFSDILKLVEATKAELAVNQ